MGQRPVLGGGVTVWLAKPRSPSAGRRSRLGLLAAGGAWEAASQPAQTPGQVTAVPSLPKGCIRLALPFFLTLSLIWRLRHLSSAGSSSRGLHFWRGKCQGNDLACKTRNLCNRRRYLTQTPFLSHRRLSPAASGIKAKDVRSHRLLTG